MKIIHLASLIFCFAATVSAQYELKATIKDKTSAVFAGIPVFFRHNEGTEVTGSTDINGEFKVRLKPGNWEVTVRKSLSETFRAFIAIEQGGLNPNNLEFTIEPNKICCGASAEKPYPKIVKLPKPPYPAAARAVRAGGEVVVAIKIDKEGKVVSAEALSGHPLLRAASVTAAKQALFETAAGEEIREAQLTFVFLEPANAKENIRRYSNFYRVEVISYITPLDFSTAKVF